MKDHERRVNKMKEHTRTVNKLKNITEHERNTVSSLIANFPL